MTEYTVGQRGLDYEARSRLRFEAKCRVEEDGCWTWSASRDFKGYGNFRYHGTHRRAHRVSYEWHRGPVPDGLELDHLCRNRACVNPAHLEAVTHAENVRRSGSPVALQALRIHCPQGHPLSGDNLVPSMLKRGHRNCRECHNTNSRRRYASRLIEVTS